MSDQAFNEGHFYKKQKLMISTNYKHRFLSPEGNQSRFLDVALKLSSDGAVRRGRGSLMNFRVFSLNVSGDGISCSSHLSEWPTQQ